LQDRRGHVGDAGGVVDRGPDRVVDGGVSGAGFVKAGATGVTQTTGNTTVSGNGEVDITSSGGSGSCAAAPALAVVVAPKFTG